VFFVFNDSKQLIFYIIVILTGIVFDYLDIASVEKVIAVGVFAGLVLYVFKTILFGQCQKCSKNKDEQKD
jgi:hypothetical protein